MAEDDFHDTMEFLVKKPESKWNRTADIVGAEAGAVGMWRAEEETQSTQGIPTDWEASEEIEEQEKVQERVLEIFQETNGTEGTRKTAEESAQEIPADWDARKETEEPGIVQERGPEIFHETNETEGARKTAEGTQKMAEGTPKTAEGTQNAAENWKEAKETKDTEGAQDTVAESWRKTEDTEEEMLVERMETKAEMGVLPEVGTPFSPDEVPESPPFEENMETEKLFSFTQPWSAASPEERMDGDSKLTLLSHFRKRQLILSAIIAL